jgi:O-Antigen ligase
MKPINLPEKLIWYYVIYTYVIYYIGGLYLLAPILAVWLSLNLVTKWWSQTDKTPEAEKIYVSTPALVWLVSMGIVAISAILGGLDFDMGSFKIISTLLNRWVRTWLLLALFPLVGHLNIRPQIIYRAACIFCIQSLILIPLFVVSYNLFDSDSYGYLSPLSKFGGGTSYYYVKIFGSVLDVGEKRLQMIAPWPPALGLVGNVFFCLCQQETNKILRLFGMAGAAAMTIGSVSRTAIICLPVVPAATWILVNFMTPWLQILLGSVAAVCGMAYFEIRGLLDDFIISVREFRSGSTKARDAIQQLALNAWKESPIWGYGTLSENGPVSVGSRGIGSHSTWYGILYAHGLLGCIPLAVAFGWSFFELLLNLKTYRSAQVGLSILLMILVYSTGDNIDTLAYLYWPGLVVLGIAFKESSYDLKAEKTPTLTA